MIQNVQAARIVCEYVGDDGKSCHRAVYFRRRPHAEVRTRAAEYGWSTRDGRDVCADHGGDDS